MRKSDRRETTDNADTEDNEEYEQDESERSRYRGGLYGRAEGRGAPEPPPRAPGGGGGRGGGGVPDSLLIGFLVFLLGLTLLVWSATGLAGVFAHGSWPTGVTFSRTPLALRHLISHPHDVPGAWPDSPKSQLSGYGLLWGLFISQLMVLLVLLLFAVSTVARWRARKAVRRRSRAGAHGPATGRYAKVPAPSVRTADTAAAASAQDVPSPGTDSSHRLADSPAAVSPGIPTAAVPSAAPVSAAAPSVVLGPPDLRRPAAIQAVRDAEGPVLVVTSDPGVWAETKDARGKLGPVLLYDPAHLCDTPSRLHWSPSAGCTDRATAAERARALLAPVRPTAKIDAAVADTAETLLRCFLHAAAVDGRQFRQVHRWAQGQQVQDAVRTLRSHPKAVSGAAGELEAALTAHPERRDIAQELTARALSALSSVHIRDSCTPNRTDTAALDSFVSEGGTLYLVGEALEDPRSRPGAMPLLTALASSVVEHGRRMAERSSSGRLDPPFVLVLEDVAAVAPLPQLPALLATGAAQGLPTLALLRSREQARTRWPDAELPIPASGSPIP